MAGGGGGGGQAMGERSVMYFSIERKPFLASLGRMRRVRVPPPDCHHRHVSPYPLVEPRQRLLFYDTHYCLKNMTTRAR